LADLARELRAHLSAPQLAERHELAGVAWHHPADRFGLLSRALLLCCALHAIAAACAVMLGPWRDAAIALSAALGNGLGGSSGSGSSSSIGLDGSSLTDVPPPMAPLAAAVLLASLLCLPVLAVLRWLLELAAAARQYEIEQIARYSSAHAASASVGKDEARPDEGDDENQQRQLGDRRHRTATTCVGRLCLGWVGSCVRPAVLAHALAVAACVFSIGACTYLVTVFGILLEFESEVWRSDEAILALMATL
jgi:hypothetical protein